MAGNDSHRDGRMFDGALNAVKHQVAAGTVQYGLPETFVLGLGATYRARTAAAS